MHFCQVSLRQIVHVWDELCIVSDIFLPIYISIGICDGIYPSVIILESFLCCRHTCPDLKSSISLFLQLSWRVDLWRVFVYSNEDCMLHIINSVLQAYCKTPFNIWRLHMISLLTEENFSMHRPSTSMTYIYLWNIIVHPK